METQTTTEMDLNQRSVTDEFRAGTPVVYGLLGKYTIASVESRILGTQALRFYKLEAQRSPLSRSSRQEPAVWVPVANATAKGLRNPITRDEVQAVLNVLSSREYYFDLSESWFSVLPKLEAAVRLEGAIGFAKVVSFLFVLKKKQLVLSSEVSKFYENVAKLLFREIADASETSVKETEEQSNRLMRHKLLHDH